jgi:hypothetical protein
MKKAFLLLIGILTIASVILIYNSRENSRRYAETHKRSQLCLGATEMYSAWLKEQYDKTGSFPTGLPSAEEYLNNGLITLRESTGKVMSVTPEILNKVVQGLRWEEVLYLPMWDSRSTNKAIGCILAMPLKISDDGQQRYFIRVTRLGSYYAPSDASMISDQKSKFIESTIFRGMWSDIVELSHLKWAKNEQ